MKLRAILFVVLCGICLSGLAAQEQTDEKAAIIKTVESAYRDGLINVGDAALVRAGFHPVFVLIGRNGDEIWQLPIEKWIERMEGDKKAGKIPRAEKVSFQFPLIDITGDTAMVKVAFFRGDVLTYTDYLLLYKFSDGWKLVSKVFHQHPAK